MFPALGGACLDRSSFPISEIRGSLTPPDLFYQTRGPEFPRETYAQDSPEEPRSQIPKAPKANSVLPSNPPALNMGPSASFCDVPSFHGSWATGSVVHC